MTYKVLISRRAQRELNQAADWIAKSAPETAERWFNKFVEALLTLRDNPHRCGFARENPSFPYELRQLLYGRRRNYRALFTIRENSVVVISIRHAAQRDLTPEDVHE